MFALAAQISPTVGMMGAGKDSLKSSQGLCVGTVRFSRLPFRASFVKILQVDSNFSDVSNGYDNNF